MKHFMLFEQFQSNFTVLTYRDTEDLAKAAFQKINKDSGRKGDLKVKPISFDQNVKYHEFRSRSNWGVFLKEDLRALIVPLYYSEPHQSKSRNSYYAHRQASWERAGSKGSLHTYTLPPDEEKHWRKDMANAKKTDAETFSKYHQMLVIFSPGPLKEEELNDYLPEKFTGVYKRDNMTFERTLRKISARDLTLEYNKYMRDDRPNVYLKNMSEVWLAEYVVKKERIEMITPDVVKSLPEYKTFIEESGYELISDSAAIRRGTYTFAFPLHFAIPDPDNGEAIDYIDRVRERRNLSKRGDYLTFGIAVFSTGYIRTVPTRDSPGYQCPTKFKFNQHEIEGWKQAFVKALEIAKADIKEWETRGLKIIVDPKDRHNYRGLVAGKNFGF